MAKQKAKLIRDRFVLHSVFKISGSKKYYARVRDLRTDTLHKFTTRQSRRDKAEQYALAWIDKFIAEEEEEEERAAAPQEVAFEDAFAKWLSLKSIRESTRKVYELDFERIYLPNFKSMSVSEIGRLDIEEFLKYLEGARDASSRNRQKHLTQLRGFFEWAVGIDICYRNPCSGVYVPRGEKQFAPLALTVEEARKLVQACGGPSIVHHSYGERKWVQKLKSPPYLQPAVVIALLAGLRRENVIELLWSEIDMKKRSINIPAEKMKGIRDLEAPINTELIGLFKKLQKGSRQKGRVFDWGGNKKAFKNALKRAELPDIRFHDHRHTFGTWLAARNVQKPIVAACLGHADRDVTDLYLRIPLKRKLEAVEKLPRLVGDKKGAGKLPKTAKE